MKKQNLKIMPILVALLFSIVMALCINVVFGISAVIVAPVLFAFSFVKRKEIALNAGLYPEVWTREVVKALNASDPTWRVGIPNKSQYASMTADGETVVINMTYFGMKPDVLINNNTYPIPIQDLDGENLPISLKKYQTKATPVTDDEVRGLAYDKIKTAQEQHVVAIDTDKNAMAIHSIAPVDNSIAATPVLVTTGADDGTGRKRLILADLLKLKKAFDDAKIPEAGRRLVLCSDHVNDLLAIDQKYSDQLYNLPTGKVYNLYGFELHTYSEMPYYAPATKAKLSFGATPAAGTHFKASVAFYLQRVAQANGFTKAYLSEAKNDPLNQRNLLNYRHYDVVLPIKNEGRGAIVSAAV